jgi:mono/diheme cytochrome c family protein
MKSLVLIASLAALVAPALSHAASPEAGKALYEKWCFPCHGNRTKTAYPGTSDALYPAAAALALKYKGKEPPLLTDRTDLTPELVTLAMREGFNGMPRFRKTEISDPELASIAAYLTRNNPPPK